MVNTLLNTFIIAFFKKHKNYYIPLLHLFSDCSRTLPNAIEQNNDVKQAVRAKVWDVNERLRTL